MAVFEKGIRLRHIGHLDIQRAMMRAAPFGAARGVFQWV